jgi:hypothetical protein
MTVRGSRASRAAEGGVQYTVRGVPARVDAALRRKAVTERRSLNEVLRDALVKEAGEAAAARRHHDLDELVGSWVEDAAFDEALAAQDTIDPALWR